VWIDDVAHTHSLSYLLHLCLIIWYTPTLSSGPDTKTTASQHDRPQHQDSRRPTPRDEEDHRRCLGPTGNAGMAAAQGSSTATEEDGAGVAASQVSSPATTADGAGTLVQARRRPRRAHRRQRGRQYRKHDGEAGELTGRRRGGGVARTTAAWPSSPEKARRRRGRAHRRRRGRAHRRRRGASSPVEARRRRRRAHRRRRGGDADELTGGLRSFFLFENLRFAVGLKKMTAKCLP
jgi:hypothetical protein